MPLVESQRGTASFSLASEAKELVLVTGQRLTVPVSTLAVEEEELVLVTGHRSTVSASTLAEEVVEPVLVTGQRSTVSVSTDSSFKPLIAYGGTLRVFSSQSIVSNLNGAMWEGATNPSGLPDTTAGTLQELVSLPSTGTEPRVVVVPAGTYTMSPWGPLEGVSRDEWLILVAESPGACVLADNVNWRNHNKIMFVGWDIKESVRMDQPSDSVVFWYCRLSTSFSTHGDPGDTWRKALNLVNSGTNRIMLIGCDVTDVAEDGIYMSGTTQARIQGSRLYDIGYGASEWGGHADAIQTVGGITDLRILDTSIGYRPGSDRGGSFAGPGYIGRVQIGAEFGNITGLTFERVWVTKSGSVGINVDSKDNTISDIEVTDVYVWNNQLSNIGSDTEATVTNLVEAQPGPEIDNPADVWRSNNPYHTFLDWLDDRRAEGVL